MAGLWPGSVPAAPNSAGQTGYPVMPGYPVVGGPVNPAWGAPVGQPAWQPVGQPRRPPTGGRSRRRRLWLIPLVALLLVAALIAGFVVARRLTYTNPLPADAALADQYGYDLTYSPDVLATRTFSFPALNLDKLDPDQRWAAFGVYTDAALRHPVDATIGWAPTSLAPWLVTVTVGPPTYPTTAVPAPHLSTGFTAVTVAPGGRWQISDRYYIVQWLGGDGQALARPKVRLFTLRADQILPGVEPVAAVAPDGGVTLSWAAVPGATAYQAYLVSRPAHTSPGAVKPADVHYIALGQTAGTSLDLADLSDKPSDGVEPPVDAWGQACVAGVRGRDCADGLIPTQNDYLEDVFPVSTQDSYYGPGGVPPAGGYQPGDHGLGEVTFAIQPLIGGGADQQAGALGESGDQAGLLAKLPVSLAVNAQHQAEMVGPMTCDDRYNLDSCWRTTVSVTMADGHTEARPAQYRPDLLADGLVGFCAAGTLICLLQSNDWADRTGMADQMTAFNQRTLADQGGGERAFDYLDPSQVPANNAARTVPDLPYPVNGTNDLVKLIAANLMDGQDYIDLSVADPSVTDDLAIDAAFEAEYQNPYVMAEASTFRFNPDDDTLYVNYAGAGQSFIDALADNRAALLAAGQAAVAAIIAPGMSPREQALAIHNWLLDHATYDYAAWRVVENQPDNQAAYYQGYPYAWNALGVMLHGRGVCLSYAEGFKLMADLAGLPAVVVTGYADGEAHAWNEVMMDGRWQVVDATFDDTWHEAGYSSTRFFGLSDAAANRTKSTEWMLDSALDDYVCP